MTKTKPATAELLAHDLTPYRDRAWIEARVAGAVGHALTIVAHQVQDIKENAAEDGHAVQATMEALTARIDDTSRPHDSLDIAQEILDLMLDSIAQRLRRMATKQITQIHDGGPEKPIPDFDCRPENNL